jgi:uncharacterized protein DUF1353
VSKFTKVLKVQPLPDDTWRLAEPLTYDVGVEGSGVTVTVPEGFVTDFASIPRGLWNLFPKWGRHGHAAVVHDFLYWRKWYSEGSITRKRADAIFLEAMVVLGTPRWKARLMYRAVRLFGELAWRANVGKDRIMLEAPKITDWT